jgi:hypothetical protein
MTSKKHKQFQQMYVEFEDIDARTQSILDEVSDSNGSNYKKKKVEVKFLHAFDLARGKNLSCAQSIN